MKTSFYVQFLLHFYSRNIGAFFISCGSKNQSEFFRSYQNDCIRVVSLGMQISLDKSCVVHTHRHPLLLFGKMGLCMRVRYAKVFHTHWGMKLASF